MTSQILEYAESGRLVEGSRSTRDDQAGTIALVVVASLGLGAGLSLAVRNALGSGEQAVTLVAIMCAVGALAILVPAVRLLRVAPAGRPVRIRPAAVLPSELVRVGNWIYREGAWVRVEQVGRDGCGRIHALLSSGDVAELSAPVTIAGDEFRPHADSVESLRK